MICSQFKSMFEFIVLITFTSLAISTWFSAERTDTFLKSFNTTFTYMKLVIFLYSFISGPSILESYVLLDFLQFYTNLEKEIKDDNATLLELLKWVIGNMIKIICLRHPVISSFAGYVVRMLYILKWTNTQDLQGIVILGFLAHMFYHFNTSDLYILHKLALVGGIYIYLYITTGFDKITEERYIYNWDSLPLEVCKLILNEKQLVSDKQFIRIINKIKAFYLFILEGDDEEHKENGIVAPIIPDIMTSIKSLRISIHAHKKDTEDVISWINTTKQLLVFYVQDLLKEEKDESKRQMLESYLNQQDPFRRRSNAIVHISTPEVEEGEDEPNMDDSDPNMEETKDEKIVAEYPEESFSSEEESSTGSGHISSFNNTLLDSQQIL